jgi:uncharacterized protein (TIGR03067 family)
MPEPATAEQDPWADVQPLLDLELSRLPDKYRVPVVLCDLEGKTRKEAARQLGVPEGTVAGRLARARTMLAKRLTRHGLVLSGGTLAAVVSQHGASAAVPTSLVSSTIKAVSLLTAGQAVTAGVISAKVAALAEGGMKTMLLNKLKIVTVVLLAVAATGGGAAGFLSHTAAARPAGHPRAPLPAAQEQPRAQGEKAVEKELEKLQGTWIAAVGSEFKGKTFTEEEIKTAAHRFVVSGTEFKWYTALQEEPIMQGTLKIDLTQKPKTMDLTFERDGKTATGLCIYELDGDSLKFCYGEPERPKEFKTREDDPNVKLYVWKRDTGK